MNYVNPPKETPKNVTHNKVYSQILCHEVGYNIYLPPNYEKNENTYPVVYHIHGWQGNESSELWATEKTFRNRPCITVFINAISSKDDYVAALNQIGSILVKEILPHIEKNYRTDSTTSMLSGFSMGGAMAFYYALTYSAVFSSVTIYAGTFHHQYHMGYQGVSASPEAADSLYEKMMEEKRYLEENNILGLVHKQADRIRGILISKFISGLVIPCFVIMKLCTNIYYP